MMLESGCQRARELLAMTPEQLYAFYLNNIASQNIKEKSERGKRASYRIWLHDLERDADSNIVILLYRYGHTELIAPYQQRYDQEGLTL